MSSNAITPSRQQLKLQTSRLIQELESTWNHDVAFPSPASVQRRSPSRNGKVATHRVNFSSNLSGVIAEGGGTTKNNPASKSSCLLKSRRPTPYKSVVNARLALSPPVASTYRQARTAGRHVAFTASASSVTSCSTNMPDDSSIDSLLASGKTTPFKGNQLDTEHHTPSTRHVTFSSDVNFTSYRSPTKTRRCTPYKQINKGSGVAEMSPAHTHSARKTSSLIQTGAVRVIVAYYTNPRRKIKPGSTRLIDSGAVRRVVSRHTTPCRLVAKRNMWSPPPSTGRLKLRDLNINTPLKNEMMTPSKNNTSALKRSSASTGGHKFRALMSKQSKSPTMERDVSRNLFH